MAEQSRSNHARIDPWFHFGLVPLLLLNLGFASLRAAHTRALWDHWSIVLAIALLLMASLMRIYGLRVQDRIIRLEERIRMAALLPLELQSLQRELTMEQIIALRFASDAELAQMVAAAVQERLSPKAIKERISVWRPDTHRV